MEWIKKVYENIDIFIDKIADEDFVNVRYSLSGDIYENNLANFVFLTKLLFITGRIDGISDKQRENLCHNILRYTHSNGEIYDTKITGRLVLNRKRLSKTNTIDTRRAETRQAFAALYLLGSQPHKPYGLAPGTKDEVNSYLSSFDWAEPWHAGSHLSHLLFFLHMNDMFFHKEDNEPLIRYAIKWVSGLQNKNDGMWYAGENVSLKQKINGAMKIMTGLDVVNFKSVNYVRKIIDTALSGINDDEACSNFNIVFVLFYANQIETGYRTKEIKAFLVDRLKLYQQYYHEKEGAFSFFKDKANDNYYGKKVTEGKNEPDIHGTVLFIWGLALIDSILELNIGFRVPLN